MTCKVLPAFFVSVVLAATAPFANGDAASTNELAGLWQAKRRFGPDIRGTLLITQNGNEWQAQIAGRNAPVTVTGDAVAFKLAGERKVNTAARLEQHAPQSSGNGFRTRGSRMACQWHRPSP